MSFLPTDDFKTPAAINLTPMLDFLFLMVMFFACLSMTRMATRDTDIALVEVKPDSAASAPATEELKLVNVSILADGSYKWVTDIRDYPVLTPEALRDELLHEYQRGQLPQDKQHTVVLLKVDKDAKWDPILKAIFAIREAGFDVHPVYAPEGQGLQANL